MPKEGKPHHHLDSNVLIGVLFYRDEKTLEACTHYCDLIGRRYFGSISLVALGEIVKKFGKLSDKRAREDALIFLGDFLFKQRVEVCFLEEDDLDLAKELKRLNYRCDIPEVVSLAIAIRDNADVFMTLDDEMLNDRFRGEVKRRYKIAIQKPRSI